MQLGQDAARKQRSLTVNPGLGSSKACAPPSETSLWDIDGLSQSLSGTSER